MILRALVPAGLAVVPLSGPAGAAGRDDQASAPLRSPD